MTRELTPEQRATLAPYERHLLTASKANYVVALPSRVTRDTLWPIYRAVFDGDHPGSPTCDFCVIRVLQRLASLYFAQGDTGQPREGQKQPVSAPQSAGVDKVPAPKKKSPQKAKNGKTTKK